MNSPLIRLAQVGCGYWGPNLLRNFSTIENCCIKYLVDTSEERRAFVKKRFPGVTAIADIDTIWNDPEIDGVIIATPAGTHFELAQKALRSRKHVFVEKPLAMHVAEVDILNELAHPSQKVVMVGHTFLYNNAVRFVKNYIDRGDLGEIRYIYSQRLNLGRIRSDIDALWNLAPHDISIIQYWLNDPEPLDIRRHGMAYMQPGVDDVVFMNITYPNKVMANIHVSWLDPQKVRKMIVVGSRKMAVYDDVAEQKVTIFDKGIDVKANLGERMDFDLPGSISSGYRSGDIHIPNIALPEPLRVEAQHFADCIRTGTEPITGIAHARKVVRILEQASS